MATQTAQLERETEQVRTELSHTLDELRGRMTPGQIVDQVVDYARQGDGAAMVGNLRRQAVENPVPLALIAAGLAWLMMSGRSTANGHNRLSRQAGATVGSAAEGAGDRLRTAADEASDRLSSGAHAVSETGRQAGSQMREAGGKMADAAGSVGDAVSQRYGRLAQAASETATSVTGSVSSARRRAAETATSARQSLATAQKSFLSACRDQPLILAGLGLALGAAIGAAFPRTRSEDRLMGDTSDDLKRTAQEFAEEQIETAKDATHEAIDEAEKAASETAEAWTASNSEGSEPDKSPSILPEPDAHREDNEPGRMKVHGEH